MKRKVTAEDVDKVKRFMDLPDTRQKRRTLAQVDKVDPARRDRSHARVGRANAFKRPDQVEAERRRAVRKELSRIKVSSVIGECPELKYVVGVPGLRTIWQLSQADTLTMAAIPGLGSVRAKRIYDYLLDKRVAVAWNPNTRVVR